MSPKKDLEHDRRQQILDAAETVFSAQGFNDARMDDIVVESGLSKGALYWYYKSKDALIMALLDRVFVSEMDSAEALISAQGTAEERLHTFARAAVRDIRHFERFMTLGYEFVALAARREAVRKKLRGYYSRYRRILAEIIEQGVENGEFSQMDPGQAALAIIGMYEGITLMWFIDPKSIVWDELADLPLEMILGGIRRRDR